MARIVICQPSTQHSAELALALARRHDVTLMTRLQFGRGVGGVWRTRILKRILHRRYTNLLPDSDIMRITPGLAVLERVVAPRLPLGMRHKLFAATSKAFQKSAARASIRLRAEVVVSFSLSADEVFRTIKARGSGTKLVLDLSHPVDIAVQQMLRDDARQFGLNVEHYDDYHPGPPKSQEIELLAADLILVGSSFSESTVRAAVGEKATTKVTSYGVDLQQNQANTGKVPNSIVFVGAFSERKGISLLLSAAEQLTLSNPEISITLVGKEYGDYRLPPVLPRNVTHVRAPTSEVVHEQISSASLLVLPSMCEGFGRVLLEALALGTPILTTERSGAPDILALSPDAPVHIVKTSERSALALRIVEALRKYPVDSAISQKAVESAAFFSQEKYEERVLAAIDEIL